jgi:hypothetical protein
MTPIKPVALLAAGSLTLGLAPAYGAPTYGSQRDPASHLPPPAIAPLALAHGFDANGRVTDHEGEALALRERAVDRVVRGIPPRGRHGRPKPQQQQSDDHGRRHGG